jgi:DNA-binding transcriptional ArsR family regulator
MPVGKEVRMDAETKARMEVRARILKALAHPSRLFIIDALAKQERCVAELTELVGADMSTVSKHLALLRGVGLIADRKAGNQVFYRLAAPCALDFFACLESIMQANVQTLIQLAR